MPRMRAIPVDETRGPTRDLLRSVQARLGSAPNFMRIMANAPVVLEAYLDFSQTLDRGVLPARLREQIALAVADANGCQSCLAAHGALARREGLSEDEVVASRRAESPNLAVAEVLRFAHAMVEKRGRVDDDGSAQLRPWLCFSGSP